MLPGGTYRSVEDAPAIVAYTSIAFIVKMTLWVTYQLRLFLICSRSKVTILITMLGMNRH